MSEQARRPIVAGNWKMNTTLPEAVELAGALRAAIGGLEAVERVVCPPFVSLAAVAERLAGSSIGVGAQNLHWEEKGAFTGEVSPTMLDGICRYAIVGHSERRQLFGEDDAMVNRKVRAALGHGLTPIVCVGENLAQNEAGQTLEVVADIEQVVIAYEPIWAIGTGRPATAEGANEVIGAIRRLLTEMTSGAVAAGLRIQYGGSVTAASAAELFAQPEIDGALVGG